MVAFTPLKIQIDDLFKVLKQHQINRAIEDAYTLCLLGEFVDDKGRADYIEKSNLSVTLEKGALETGFM